MTQTYSHDALQVAERVLEAIVDLRSDPLPKDAPIEILMHRDDIAAMGKKVTDANRPAWEAKRTLWSCPVIEADVVRGHPRLRITVEL